MNNADLYIATHLKSEHTHDEYLKNEIVHTNLILSGITTEGGSGFCRVLDEKIAEIYWYGTITPSATGSTTVATLPVSLKTGISFIAFDTTNNSTLSCWVTKAGALSITFNVATQQSICLHETFICK